VLVEGNHIDENITQQFSLDLTTWNVDGSKENPLTTLGIRPKGTQVEPIIKSVVEQSAADRAGLKDGDKILSVNGEKFDWQMLVKAVQTGKEITFSLERYGQVFEIAVLPDYSEKEQRYLIGIQPKVEPLSDKYRTVLQYDVVTALQKAVAKVLSLVKSILQFVGNLLTGNLSLNNMGGPISIAKGAGATAEIGLVYYLSFMALISVNLGVMNLFPILPLDGGQLILLGMESVLRQPISEKIQLRFQQVGIAFVLTLMLFVLFNDLMRF
jgi:regulator of sigma E protease